MHLNFINDLNIAVLAAAAVAGTTTITTSVIDTQGYDSVAIIAMTGDVTDTSVLTLTAQAGDESDGSDAVDLTSAIATFTADATSGDNKLLIVDLHKPNARYVRATLDRATANAVVSGVIAILYNAHERPVTLDDVVVAATLVNDPQPA
ncbi:hypothetical protein JQX09_17650 [Sulfitobacter pseudonitzschiae]|uniref:Uncharacterized protein n=1 Tax=Pseudosulfitobacter pseudonitzschiae TaxID=1402135 RepID=A0A9Q2NN28_9RHOB|nr:hypothetical protein [Pseudosulfitobacter pseudonitzschiae]MBM2293757.1 hypothetical protein [Pseudosulfitobacter pseudonitzschiae]MBM2298675.1 hypothetical protein [Pseudosulfitobacter pseudonitzschiae]MBM2303589.1 hypothetical protein [Pseudosulfitobacter pseudonitzschiae]MBM2313372.1 hypothetical protein [Pseudosulfitobacter pseudonitzschiae]MBM2318285.1 hypothetical protein [Pseudosulfitobacter pseudonitzschiae]